MVRYDFTYKGRMAFIAHTVLKMPKWSGKPIPMMIPVRVEKRSDDGVRVWNPTRIKKRPLDGYGTIGYRANQRSAEMHFAVIIIERW